MHEIALTADIFFFILRTVRVFTFTFEEIRQIIHVCFFILWRKNFVFSDGKHHIENGGTPRLI